MAQGPKGPNTKPLTLTLTLKLTLLTPKTHIPYLWRAFNVWCIESQRKCANINSWGSGFLNSTFLLELPNIPSIGNIWNIKSLLVSYN